ncbi:MAG: glutathione S-transferase [Pseudomonadota bacterium]
MSAALPILYSFRRCPYAMRGRMGLFAAGVQCELREVKLSNKPEAMLDASPKGTVPVLQLPDGQVIEESLDMMAWALAKRDPHGWLVADEGETRALIAENDGPFKHHLDRYKYPNRYEDAVAQTHRAGGAAFLAKLETRLVDTPYLFGAAETLADVAIAPFVRQFANTDRIWFDAAPYPRLQTWLARFLSSPVFTAIMADKLTPWTPGDAPILFLSSEPAA